MRYADGVNRLYTDAEDTLNPEDLIYPRAVTRIGTKFQANVPTEEEQAKLERKRPDMLKASAAAGPDKTICGLLGTDLY